MTERMRFDRAAVTRAGSDRRFAPVPKYNDREKLAFAVSHAQQRAEIRRQLEERKG
jgi:hypothetical protein